MRDRRRTTQSLSELTPGDYFAAEAGHNPDAGHDATSPPSRHCPPTHRFRMHLPGRLTHDVDPPPVVRLIRPGAACRPDREPARSLRAAVPPRSRGEMRCHHVRRLKEAPGRIAAAASLQDAKRGWSRPEPAQSAEAAQKSMQMRRTKRSTGAKPRRPGRQRRVEDAARRALSAAAEMKGRRWWKTPRAPSKRHPKISSYCLEQGRVGSGLRYCDSARRIPMDLGLAGNLRIFDVIH
jgi:hypothetical protein